MSIMKRRILVPFFLVLRSSVSLVPSAAPTFIKSSEPSAVPSVNVLTTAMPSSSSVIVTNEPSFVPTSTPTIQSSSNSPTQVPSTSSKPTVEPSVHPTYSALPSEQPTRTKSSNPSDIPSVSPSEQISAQPSLYPSLFPTDEGIIQTTPEIEMIINGIAIEMQTDEIQSYFEAITSNHILYYWRNQSKPIPLISVGTQIQSQNVISSQKERYLSEKYLNQMNDGKYHDQNKRTLQISQLVVRYTHELEISADNADGIISSDIYLLPFQDDGGQQFLNSLITNDPSSEKFFQYAENVSVRIVKKSSSKITIIIASVSVAVGVIFIFSIWYVFVRGKCKRRTVIEGNVLDYNVAPSVSFNNDDDLSEGPIGKHDDADNDEGLSYSNFSVEQQNQELVRTWTGTGALAKTEILRVVDLPNDDSNSDDDDKSGSFSA